RPSVVTTMRESRTAQKFTRIRSYQRARRASSALLGAGGHVLPYRLHGSRQLVGVDRDLDDRRFARAEGGTEGVAQLVGMVHIVAFGTEKPRELVIARVADVAADVARAVEGPLVGLLGAPAVVVHDQRDGVDLVAHRRLDLL